MGYACKAGARGSEGHIDEYITKATKSRLGLVWFSSLKNNSGPQANQVCRPTVIENIQIQVKHFLSSTLFYLEIMHTKLLKL